MSSALFQKLWKTLPVNTYLSYVWFLVSQTVRSEYLPELCLMHHSKDYEKVYLWITTWVSSCPASAESVPVSILCFTRCFVFDSLQSTCLSYVDFSKTPGLQPDLSCVFPRSLLNSFLLPIIGVSPSSEVMQLLKVQIPVFATISKAKCKFWEINSSYNKFFIEYLFLPLFHYSSENNYRYINQNIKTSLKCI